MYFAKDMRVIKDSYRDQYDKIFGKRDVFYHTKRSGRRKIKINGKKRG